MSKTEPITDSIICHEVLDRAHILCEMLEVSLADHPGLENGKLRERYDEAQKALVALYAEAGECIPCKAGHAEKRVLDDLMGGNC